MNTIKKAVLAAIAIALLIPSVAFANTISVSIVPNQTFTGVPASIDFPESNANMTVAADPFTIVSGTNDQVSGYHVVASLTDLTDGPNTLDVSYFSMLATSSTSNANWSVVGDASSGSGWGTNSGVEANVWKSTQAYATPDSVNVNLELFIPLGTPPGDYVAAFDFIFALL